MHRTRLFLAASLALLSGSVICRACLGSGSLWMFGLLLLVSAALLAVSGVRAGGGSGQAVRLGGGVRPQWQRLAGRREYPLLGELLVQKHGLITAAQLETALERQRKTGHRLGEILVWSGVASSRQLARVLEDQRSYCESWRAAWR